uniref:WSC domain-containing protein n=1 Tax=Macrostomum lignano TaxID=282301 RepID=A0A1I8F1Q9_9PLAT
MRLWLLLLILAVWAAMSANGASLSSLPAKKAIKKPPSVGCFKDKAKPRDLPKLARLGSVTPAACAAQCFKLRFSYAGVQNGNECRCGNSYGRHGRAQSSECNKPCNGSRVQTCGGFWRNLILKTGFKALQSGRLSSAPSISAKSWLLPSGSTRPATDQAAADEAASLPPEAAREEAVVQKFLQKMRLRYKARLQRRVQRFKKRIVKAKTRFGKKLRKINKRFQRKVMRKLKKKPLTKRRLRLVKRAFFRKGFISRRAAQIAKKPIRIPKRRSPVTIHGNMICKCRNIKRIIRRVVRKRVTKGRRQDTTRDQAHHPTPSH